MYSPLISETDLQVAKYLKSHSKSRFIRDRMHVLYLRGKGHKPGVCAQMAMVSPNSVTRWIKTYIQSGLHGLQQLNNYRPKSELVYYRSTIKLDFSKDPPQSVGQAAARIERLTGLKRGSTQVRHFLKHVLKYRYRKYRSLPGGKKSIEELNEIQTDFMQKTLSPLIKKASKGQIELFFMDASHPVMGFHTAHKWSEKPIYVRSSSGRQRMNILGAMHAISKELFSITTEDYIKATTVVEMIRYMRKELPGKRIHIVLDNAKYQRCELVEKAAKKYRVNMCYLPPYSPNLNLIERFWKLLKKEVLAGVHHPTKDAFVKAVHNFIDQVNLGVFDHKIQPLMNLKFQTIKAA